MSKSLDQTIFLTGFPGFIAERLAKRLAAEGARLLMLVQPEFLGRAREDVLRISEETGTPASNFLILEGDITRPALGLNPSDLEMTRAEATTIFHLAAIYDLAVQRDTGVRVNVEGTRNVSQLARSLKNL
ncbi:MAG: SDR family oxidoreductase, partial [Pyrinomonadaceae bacterium]